MANTNFIVQNGLTVGPLTISAGNGDVSTSGNITVAGNLQVTGQIISNSSAENLSANTVSVTSLLTAGSAFTAFSGNGDVITGGNIRATGNLTALGFINTTGNILSSGATHNKLSVNGFGNITTGNIQSLSVPIAAGITIAGVQAATVSDAQAFAIALS